MDFNKKIAKKILSDLQNAKNLTLSFDRLEANIYKNLGAMNYSL